MTRSNTPNLSRRAFMKGAALGGAALGLAGASGNAQAQTNRLVIASVGGSWLEAIKQIYIADTNFEDSYGVDVIWDIQMNEASVSKGLSTCGNPVDDAFQAQPINAAQFVAGNCAEPLDPAIVTNLANVDPQFRMGDHFVATMRLHIGLAYNSKYVEEPKGWDVLLDPRYKGKIGMPSFAWFGHTLIYSLNKLNGGNASSIDPAIKMLADIIRGNNATIVQNSNNADTLLQREEVWVMPHLLGRQFNLKKSGLPIEIYFPDQFPSIDLGYVVPTGPNAEVAQKFVNTTLDPVCQTKILERFKYAPTNSKTVVPEGYEAAMLPDYALGRAVEMDWQQTIEHSNRDLQRWNQDVLG